MGGGRGRISGVPNKSAKPEQLFKGKHPWLGNWMTNPNPDSGPLHFWNQNRSDSIFRTREFFILTRGIEKLKAVFFDDLF
jgi:hypothetical protein